MATNANAVKYSPYVTGVPVADVRVGIDDANYTVGLSEYIVGYTALSATRTVTLPAITRTGRRLIVKDEDGGCTSSAKIVIAGTIDGSTNLELVTAFGWAELYFNGSVWARVA